jgi:hypothetical protein
VTYDSATQTATFTPTSALTPDTVYTATLSSGIEDASGNPLAETSWTFTTAAGTGGGEPPIDGWGISQLYPTLSGGPTWQIQEVEEPWDDGHFYYTAYDGTTVEYEDDGVWFVDATSGTDDHGIRMHVDSPSGEWKNTEITGYVQIVSGSDQFTIIGRHGPSYSDNGGCEAYGYYAATSVDGTVWFKKKLYHGTPGYTKRIAQDESLDNIGGDWIGVKFVLFDKPNGDVHLELWIDRDSNNQWRKVTEFDDTGSNVAVGGGDKCGRDAEASIPEGTRVSYRMDDSEFRFSKLSVREIQPPSSAN